MNPTAIKHLLCFIVLMSVSVHAEKFSVEAPSTVTMGENFSVTLRVSNVGQYDVKLAIIDGKRVISRIYANGWKSSFYYVPNSLTSEASFTLQATEVISQAQFCVRVRKAGTSTFEENCQSITVQATSSPSSSAYLNESLSSSVLEESPPLILMPAQNKKEKRITTREYTQQLLLIGVTFSLLLVIALVCLVKYTRTLLQSARRYED